VRYGQCLQWQNSLARPSPDRRSKGSFDSARTRLASLSSAQDDKTCFRQFLMDDKGMTTCKTGLSALPCPKTRQAAPIRDHDFRQ
jgi:hypothetical protein